MEKIDELSAQIAFNPKIGKKFQNVNNIYKISIGLAKENKGEYNLVYFYNNKLNPIYLINIFRKNEKDILSKVVETLIQENS